MRVLSSPMPSFALVKRKILGFILRPDTHGLLPSRTMLPSLATETLAADGLRWTFTVRPDHPFFEGHFPGHPILPGVVALGWMMAAAERFLGRPLPGVEVLNVKFQVVILPGAALELTLTPKPGGLLQGILRSEAGVHASALIPGQEA